MEFLQDHRVKTALRDSLDPGGNFSEDGIASRSIMKQLQRTGYDHSDISHFMPQCRIAFFQFLAEVTLPAKFCKAVNLTQECMQRKRFVEHGNIRAVRQPQRSAMFS